MGGICKRDEKSGAGFFGLKMWEDTGDSVTLLCLTASSGVPLYCRSRGGSVKQQVRVVAAASFSLTRILFASHLLSTGIFPDMHRIQIYKRHRFVLWLKRKEFYEARIQWHSSLQF